MRGQVSPHPHTWLPYITPNGVRLAQEALKKTYFPFVRVPIYIYNTFFPSMFLYPWNIKKIMEISFLQKKSCQIPFLTKKNLAEFS